MLCLDAGIDDAYAWGSSPHFILATVVIGFVPWAAVIYA
jgi:hypothetical protein